MNIRKDSVTILKSDCLKPIHIKTGPYPIFPTDLQQPLTALLCKVDGESIVEETMFNNRTTQVEELLKLGANIKVINNKIIINGGNELNGGMKLYCKDLRGGAAILLGALMASKTTIVADTKYIDRGYQDIVENLNNVGAKIIKHENNEKII